MPPCFDVYVWVKTIDRPATLSRFIERYVDGADAGDPRFEAFVRTFVTEEPLSRDAEALADLRRDPSTGTAVSIYLRATGFREAILTVTEEGDTVLGLGLDDPVNEPAVQHRASDVLAQLVDEFGGSAGVGGVELPPPQSLKEWADDGLVALHVGAL